MPQHNAEPNVTQPEIKPNRETPDFTPAKSPDIEPLPEREINPSRVSPEIIPDSSPDATPRPSPPEIQPIH